MGKRMRESARERVFEGERKMAGRIVVGSKSDFMRVARTYARECFSDGEGHYTIRKWNGAWWHWTGGRWRAADDERIYNHLAKWLADEAGVTSDEGEVCAFFPTKRDVDTCFLFLKATFSDYDLEQPGWLRNMKPRIDREDVISFRNCLLVFDGKKQVFEQRESSSLWFDSGCVECLFDVNATCPEWIKFLDEVFLGDEELKRLLAQWFGYCLLSGDLTQQRFLLMHGLVRAGKGTVMRVLKRLMGNDRYHATTSSDFVGMFHLKEMETARLVAFEDLNRPEKKETARLMMERLKSIVGCDSMYADVKHSRGDRNVQIKAKVMISTNEFNVLPDEGRGLSSKMIVLPFDNSFLGREDLMLDRKLRNEIEGIATWAVAGALDLRRSGAFCEPKRSMERKRVFVFMNSPVMMWSMERCVANAKGWTSTERLYEDFCRWWSSFTDETLDVNKMSFGKLFSTKVGLCVRRTKRSDKGGRVWGYAGVSLLA